MNKLTKRLLKVANEKADPRSCLHHFATCENCGSRINILRLAEIINSKSSNPSDNNDFKKPCPNCNGTGRMIENHTLRDVKFDCLTCKGQGFIKS